MRVLQIGADRSQRGILMPGSAAYQRQKAYAQEIGILDIIGFSRRKDPFVETMEETLRTHPTRSLTRFMYGFDALFLATRLPWPDVVSSQDPFETGLVALVISRFLQRPLHVQVHTDFLSPAYTRLSLINRLRVMVAGIVLRRASRLRVVSERIRISIQTKYALRAPITVLPIYADIDRMRTAKADSALVKRFEQYSTKLLYVGRLEREKNPCLALRSFAKAAPSDTCLIIVGEGRESSQMKRLAKELGVESRVFFEEGKSAAEYYPIADLVLVTSHYEGYGLVIVEGLAAGKPVLSTDVGIAGEAGALIAEGDYADALKRWFEAGPREGTLTEYPYASFDEYVAAYSADIKACTSAT